MNEPKIHPLTMDGMDPRNLRGDPITGDRYYSKDFAQLEWDHMWKKIWHVAGRESEIPEPGDFVVHNFLKESVFAVRQDDGSIRAFYNVCLHRGQPLVAESSSMDNFMCPYHGWIWGKEGLLQEIPDPESFPQGDPCGKMRLKEVRCDTWGGFIWYCMDPNGQSLMHFLDPIPEVYKGYPLETLVRISNFKIELNTNWKYATDNFVESYHTRTLHPQVPPWIDQDYWSARIEMFPQGHGRTIQPMRPSLRDRLPGAEKHHPFDDQLRFWDIDPDAYPDFETKAMQGWKDLKAAKRRLWKEKGYVHYENMDDEQLTDSPHTVLFPNVTISFLPDQIIFFRTEPHPDDPEKCTFDLWSMVFPVEGVTEFPTAMEGVKPVQEVNEVDYRVFDGGRGVPELEGQIVFQDMMLAEAQQRGMHSQGYEDAYLSSQEVRVRFFHEVLNDYLEGRKPDLPASGDLDKAL